MTDFFYRVKDLNNKIMDGTVNAVNISDAVSRLEHKGFIVLEIIEENNTRAGSFIPRYNSDIDLNISEKKEFFNSFFVMYKSGLSIIEIFNSILSSSRNIKIKTMCSDILNGINSGGSLKDALKSYSKVLGDAYTSLIAAGEESGKLDNVLSGIIENLNKEDEIKTKIISSVTYPVIIFLLAIGVGLLFKFFVFKVFANVSEGVNIGIIAVSAIFKIILAYIVIFAAAFLVWKDKKLLRRIKEFFSKFIFISNIMKNYYFANFFLIMSLAYEAGITAAESIHLANSVININDINRKIRKAEKMVRQGCMLSTALAAADVFSANSISQISAGEKAGELEKVFKSTAFNYENSLNLALQAALKLIEPVMIGITGIFVAYIAISAYKGYYSALFSMF